MPDFFRFDVACCFGSAAVLALGFWLSFGFTTLQFGTSVASSVNRHVTVLLLDDADDDDD